MVCDHMICGKIISLRALDKEDLIRTHEWLHRPDVNDRIGVKIPFSLETQQVWFEKLAVQNDKYVFAIELNGCHIGNVSLDVDARHKNGRVSIFIADPSLRSHGAGSDAINVLCFFAFQELNLHKVWCKTNADVVELQKFYTRNGFVLEGRLKEHELKDGRFVDKWLFGRLNNVTE